MISLIVMHLWMNLHPMVLPEAEADVFPLCPSSTLREDLDNFCPRLEGVTLDRCCPNVVQQAPQICSYSIVENRGQATLVNSNYTTCQNNRNVTVNCCRISQTACFRDQQDLPFLGRAIAPRENNNKCCFENCPPASYWRAQPNPNARITSRHELGKGGLANVCIDQVVDACTYGNAESCQPSAPCPPVVTTGPGTNAGAGMGAGTGGSGGTGTGYPYMPGPNTGSPAPIGVNGPSMPPGGGGGAAAGAVQVGPN